MKDFKKVFGNPIKKKHICEIEVSWFLEWKAAHCLGNVLALGTLLPVCFEQLEIHHIILHILFILISHF